MSLLVKDFNAVVGAVCDKQPPLGIDGDAVRLPHLAGPRSSLDNVPDKLSVLRELCHPVAIMVDRGSMAVGDEVAPIWGARHIPRAHKRFRTSHGISRLANRHQPLPILTHLE